MPPICANCESVHAGLYCSCFPNPWSCEAFPTTRTVSNKQRQSCSRVTRIFRDKWVLVNSVTLQSLAFSIWTTDHPVQSFNLLCLLALICSLSFFCDSCCREPGLNPLLLQSIVPTGALSVLPPLPCPRDHSVHWGFHLRISCGVITSATIASRREVACFLCARPRVDCQRIWCLGDLVDMENCARRLTGGGLEETTMSAASTSVSPDETSSFHTTVEECLSSVAEMAIGDCSGPSSSREQKSEYFSARAEEMMRSKSQFSSDVEHEIEHSKVHWSEVTGLSELSEDDDHEEVNGENREVFAELKNDPQWGHHKWGHFFFEWPFVWKLGRKIAEGGQAAIFEVLDIDGSLYTECLLKVFKRGSRLSDLKEQWPCGILQREVMTGITYSGTMLDDGRFAFLMGRCWGDLRKLIDQAMQEKNNQGPPFPYEWNGKTLLAKDIMRNIAIQMVILHNAGIIHRDLKAANILYHIHDKDAHMFVADFECSIGVVGTGFWRAPEILLALKNRSAIDFTKKVDVYSYGMTCFEVVTGRLPFEGELEACRASNDLVIEGQRPKLPSDLDVPLKDLIERCWNLVPNERPSFEEIFEVFNTF